ncbi:DUF2252 domain-containing protein [Actinomadura rupiterrae]|uniref:DUF2252 domain-containing protein n=1 Tax=Actinomadura rupiterrae TaxID=559627 RepID=UPI0020A38BC4|nr:DUF2252 domain-containing protein [Actinomadura rupiterrae]MCP2336325.1 uncharacterized protein (DUF2252 family) [Actinomadura rupiterrae]
MAGTPRDEYAAGKALRKRVKRSAHADWTPPADRRDPAAAIFAQDADRLPDLVPIRHERMAAGAFPFLRGAAAVMAGDLAATPSTGLRVQACGDAHLLNFGLYASPERILVFDVNDFDETLPGPWEWDVKRLAASLAVAAREQGFGDKDARRTARKAATAYRERMRELAGMSNLAAFYTMTKAADVYKLIKKKGARKQARKLFHHSRGRGNLQAVEKLTRREGGSLRIVDQPPLVEHAGAFDAAGLVKRSLRDYAGTLPEDVATLLDRYRYMDAARKVVGVGSVGTRCFVVVLQGRDADDPLVLQVKQAMRSVLEPYLSPSAYPDQGRRVVAGQRLLQSVSDVFLGWSADGAHDYYWRQLRDMKGSVDVTSMNEYGLGLYARLCGGTLAVAHANTGPRLRIAGYLGRSDTFDDAIADFAMAYADQNDKDYAVFKSAVASRD